MARFIHGLLCGLVLLRLHRPLGRELLEVPAVSAADALSARSIALLGVAGAVLLARRSIGACQPAAASPAPRASAEGPRR